MDTRNQYSRAKEALDGLDADVKIGIAVGRDGSKLVRVNIAPSASQAVVDKVHRRLRDIPHEIRRVPTARLDRA